MADRAIVCFDAKDTSKMADESDWCYMASRGSKNGHTLNGGSPIYRNSHFNIQNWFRKHLIIVFYFNLISKADFAVFP